MRGTLEGRLVEARALHENLLNEHDDLKAECSELRRELTLRTAKIKRLNPAAAGLGRVPKAVREALEKDEQAGGGVHGANHVRW